MFKNTLTDQPPEEDNLRARMIQVLEELLRNCGLHHMPYDPPKGEANASLSDFEAEQGQALAELCAQGMRIISLAQLSGQTMQIIPEQCPHADRLMHAQFPPDWRIVDDERTMSFTDMGSVLVVCNTDDGEESLASLVIHTVNGERSYRLILP